MWIKTSEAEIDEYCLISVPGQTPQDDVFWLQISMDDVRFVQHTDGSRDVNSDSDHFRNRKSSASIEYVRERVSVDKLHDEQEAELGIRDLLDDLRNVFTLQFAEQDGFATKAGDKFAIFGRVGQEAFDRYASRFLIDGNPYFPNAAFGDLALKAVLSANHCAGEETHGRAS
jgi:hypothetical protein